MAHRLVLIVLEEHMVATCEAPKHDDEEKQVKARVDHHLSVCGGDGCVGVWMCGWVCGCVGVWVCGFVGLWVCGCVGV